MMIEQAVETPQLLLPKEREVFQSRFGNFPVALRYLMVDDPNEMQRFTEIMNNKQTLRWFSREEMSDEELMHMVLDHHDIGIDELWCYGAVESAQAEVAQSNLSQKLGKEHTEHIAGQLQGVISFQYNQDTKKVIAELVQSGILPPQTYIRMVYEGMYAKHPDTPPGRMRKALLSACIELNRWRSQHVNEEFVESLGRSEKWRKFWQNMGIDVHNIAPRLLHKRQKLDQYSDAYEIISHSPIDMIIYFLIDEKNTASISMMRDIADHVGNIASETGKAKNLRVYLLNWLKVDDAITPYGLFTKESFIPAAGMTGKDINLYNTSKGDATNL